jgi:cell division septum initiation protein DivIVA
LRSRLQRTEKRVLQSHSSKAQEYRRKARSCELFAANAQSAHDHDGLTRMRDSLLALAAHEEWLDGLPPTPPANVMILRPTHH